MMSSSLSWAFEFHLLTSRSPLQTKATPSQLRPNSWDMIRGFKIICEHLGVPASPNAFFFLFTLTHLIGDGLNIGWLSFRAHNN